MRDAEYLKLVLRTLWQWADRHCPDALDGGGREKRPPVLRRDCAAMNVIVPRDRAVRDRVLGAIPPKGRQRYFASLRSSQAMTQSLFGAIRAFGRLDLLRHVPAECGRPAFLGRHTGCTLDFEYEVRYLGEPRPTSIDVLLSGPASRVAIECKFTESEFGTCSRLGLPKDHPEHCDGSYRVQKQRSSRCVLTEIGVRYWDHLPRLFDWPDDRDHHPCPFGDVYQLARNALAAAVTPDGELDPAGGHALVVYDARNPAFHAGGKAGRQWERALGACRVPGLLRRLSWQCLMAAFLSAPELRYLVQGMGEKYGVAPS